MSLGQVFLNLMKPLVNTELSAIANTITTNKAVIEAEAATSGQSAVVYVTAKLNALVAKNPFLSLVATTFEPALEAYLDGLETSGIDQVSPLIDSIVAWITKEEAVI